MKCLLIRKRSPYDGYDCFYNAILFNSLNNDNLQETGLLVKADQYTLIEQSVIWNKPYITLIKQSVIEADKK